MSNNVGMIHEINMTNSADYKLTVKLIPMLLLHQEFLHKGSSPFSVGFLYLDVVKEARRYSI